MPGSEADSRLTARALRTGTICMSDLRQSEAPLGGCDPLLAFGYQSLTSLPVLLESQTVAAVSLSR